MVSYFSNLNSLWRCVWLVSVSENTLRTNACIRGTSASKANARGIAVNGSYSHNFSPSIASNYQPNPGDQLVTLEHLLPQGEGYVFQVVNALGQEELWIDLEEGDELYEWDTSGLQQGLYYVFLYKEGLLVEYKLLSILH